MSLPTSTNPAVRAILDGRAPHQARLAAAGGLLPLPQADLMEMLVALRHWEEPEIAECASETLNSQDSEALLSAAKSDEMPTAVLDYLATLSKDAREIHEA